MKEEILNTGQPYIFIFECVLECVHDARDHAHIKFIHSLTSKTHKSKLNALLEKGRQH